MAIPPEVLFYTSEALLSTIAPEIQLKLTLMIRKSVIRESGFISKPDSLISRFPDSPIT